MKALTVDNESLEKKCLPPLHCYKTFSVVAGLDFCAAFLPQLCGCCSRLSHGLIAKAGFEEEWKPSVSA